MHIILQTVPNQPKLVPVKILGGEVRWDERGNISASLTILENGECFVQRFLNDAFRGQQILRARFLAPKIYDDIPMCVTRVSVNDAAREKFLWVYAELSQRG
jgi:hypothetical protein